MARLLIIDACLATRIAAELNKRLRPAQSVASLGYKLMKDPPLLRFLAENYPDAVLVTSDDHMPATHADVLAETRNTLAIIVLPPGSALVQEQWSHELVHFWAPKMQQQPLGSVKRYKIDSIRDWKPRRRPTRRVDTAPGEEGTTT